MTLLKLLATGLLSLAAGAASAATTGMGYSIGDNGRKLVIMGDLADPGTLTGKTITNGTGTVLRISELTVRPATGQLYGYSDFDNTVYLIDPNTGKATAQATHAGATAVNAVGFDFNNQIDRARIVAITDENLVYNPDANTITAFTPLFYVAGDVNAGADPTIFANAYTNAVPMASSTIQYVIDSELDILATLGNNAGTLSTVGAFFLDGMAFDIGDAGGFDILSFFEGDNMAYAILNSTMGQGLYTFSLTPDANGQINLASIGMMSSDFGLLRGLAVAPAAIPVPAAGLLLAGGIVALGALRRRRQAA